MRMDLIVGRLHTRAGTLIAGLQPALNNTDYDRILADLARLEEIVRLLGEIKEGDDDADDR